MNNSGVTGVYGTKGIASSDNMPGSRLGAATWVDKNGNFWLFGGLGYDSTGNFAGLNDLWEYDPTSNQWTWVGGSETANNKGIPGVYGTKGIASSDNMPGSRLGAATWVDANGNLWLFGGFGLDQTVTDSIGNLNDLWKYNPTNNQWTWMSGAETMNSAGVYGTKGLAAAANIPGGRAGSAAWEDANGNLWLFGGGYYFPPLSSDNSDILQARGSNDFWKYNPTTNQWTWMGGSSTPDVSGIYGTKGVTATDNIPGARGASAAWVDANGNFWLFGGVGDDSTGTIGFLNDLWEINPSGGSPASRGTTTGGYD